MMHLSEDETEGALKKAIGYVIKYLSIKSHLIIMCKKKNCKK